MRARTVAVLGVLLGVAGATVYYYERQLELLRQLSFKLLSFSFGPIVTGIETQINTVIRIYSNSTLDAQVKGLYIDVYVNGNKLGSVTGVQPFILPARGYSDAQLQILVSPDLIIGELAQLAIGFLGNQDFAINLIGFVRIQEAFLTISVPFNYATTFKQILQ
jgi:LEA14-like dessication related protein